MLQGASFWGCHGTTRHLPKAANVQERNIDACSIQYWFFLGRELLASPARISRSTASTGEHE